MLIGLDFGTSYSQAAAMQIDEPVLLMPSGVYGIPSAFYYDRDSGVLIGTDALDEGQGTSSDNLKTSIKLNLSEKHTADGRTFTPQDIVSEIYKYLSDVAQRVANQKNINEADNIEGAVISAPVNFTAREIDLIKKACMRPLTEGGAGLPVYAVIKEPVAAALAYFKSKSVDAENILVFDLGGGTCDIAVLRREKDDVMRYTVVDSDMIRVGADRWDERLAAYIAYELTQQIGQDIERNDAFLRKIRTAARDVKHSLTEHDFKNARVEINGTVYKVPVTRRIFDALTRSCLEQVMSLLKKVYDRNRKKLIITDIICVGGGSLMPQVAKEIREVLPGCSVHSFCPETAVVFGTAIYADILSKDPDLKRIRIDDISSFSYGIRVYDDYESDRKKEVISNLIVKGDTLPTSSLRTFKTVKRGDSISISVYENTIEKGKCDVSDVPENPIGKLVLTLPPKTPAGVRVHVTMRLNTSRALEVSARDDKDNYVAAEFVLNEDYKKTR